MLRPPILTVTPPEIQKIKFMTERNPNHHNKPQKARQAHEDVLEEENLTKFTNKIKI